MNRTSLPISPFTTALSGSARETELRIRSIFQWKRRRPPLPLLILLLAAALLCGNLVSCRTEEPDLAQLLLEAHENIPMMVAVCPLSSSCPRKGRAAPWPWLW